MSGPLASVRAAPSISRLGARAALFSLPRRAEHDRRQKSDEELHPLEATQLDPPEVNPKAFGHEDPWKQYHPLPETVRSKPHHLLSPYAPRPPSSRGMPWSKVSVGNDIWRQMHPLVNTVKSRS